MPRETTVSDSTVIAAGPHALWELIADPSRMGRWSPENTGASSRGVLGVGEEFTGSNRRGRARWHTRCRVVRSEPGVAFGFEVRAIGVRVPRLRAPIATWLYTFEAVAGGTRVTETWTDDRRRWPDPVAAVFDRVVTGGRLFADHQRRNIARTLARLEADVEGGVLGTPGQPPSRRP